MLRNNKEVFFCFEWIAFSSLVAIIRKRLNLDLSLYTILQILANSAQDDLFPPNPTTI
jgi:hypothetical protein